MRSVMVVVLSLVFFVGGSVFGAETEPQPKVKIKVVITWPPLRLGLEVGKASANAYHGTAFVEGNDLVVQFDHGTVLPHGGFVVDPSAKIAPDAATRLGLTATQQLVSGTYDVAATTYFTVTGGPTIRLPLTTSASRSFTCVATVATNGGKALLGKGTVSGATVTAAASACHDFTRKKFAANLAWSDPARVCARAPSSTPRRVEALDHFEELGNAGGYNRVGGYSVVCTATPQVTQFPTAPEVVKR